MKKDDPKSNVVASSPAPDGSAFRLTVGTVQLFITRDTPFLHLGVMLPEYDSKNPVGCKWERAVVQWTCDYLNARSNRSALWEDDVRAAIKLGEQAVDYTPNAKLTDSRE